MGNIFDKFTNNIDFRITPDGKYFIVEWSVKGSGFGEYVFWKEGNKMMCDNECDSKQSIKDVLCNMVDECEFVN